MPGKWGKAASTEMEHGDVNYGRYMTGVSLIQSAGIYLDIPMYRPAVKWIIDMTSRGLNTVISNEIRQRQTS